MFIWELVAIRVTCVRQHHSLWICTILLLLSELYESPSLSSLPFNTAFPALASAILCSSLLLMPLGPSMHIWPSSCQRRLDSRKDKLKIGENRTRLREFPMPCDVNSHSAHPTFATSRHFRSWHLSIALDALTYFDLLRCQSYPLKRARRYGQATQSEYTM